MARIIEQRLYAELVSSKFSFLKRGEIHISDIYRAVRMKYKSLCDDNYFCSESCTKGNNQPEWNHTVRNAIQKIKNSSSEITFSGKKGYWIFK